MPHDLIALSPDVLAFLGERHVGALTTVLPDGSPHVCAVGFTWDDETKVARIITSDATQKVRNVDRNGHAAVAQIDGPRWLSLAGRAHVERDAASVEDAVGRYRARYREPRENPQRVVIVIEVDRVLGRA